MNFIAMRFNIYKEILCGAGCLAIMATIFSGCGNGDKQENKPATVHNVFVVTPQGNGVSRQKDYAAVVQETRTIGAGFKTGGQIERLYAKEGDYVKQGQLLAELDGADYALDVERLNVQYQQLADEMKRKEKLHAAKNLSENEYEAALAGLKQVKVALDLSRNKLDYTKLYAPASGYIVKRNAEKSETVNAGTAVFELMDDSRLEVVVDIPVSEFLNRDNFASFTGRSSQAPDEAFPLQMLSLTPKADNNQLYQLKLTVPSGSRTRLTSGMNLTVTIRQKEGTDNTTYTLPARALFANDNGDGKQFVWVVSPKDSTVARQEVVTSGNINGNNQAAISSGLQGSEMIVRAGVHVLTDGEKVNIIHDDESSTNVGNLL